MSVFDSLFSSRLFSLAPLVLLAQDNGSALCFNSFASKIRKNPGEYVFCSPVKREPIFHGGVSISPVSQHPPSFRGFFLQCLDISVKIKGSWRLCCFEQAWRRSNTNGAKLDSSSSSSSSSLRASVSPPSLFWKLCSEQNCHLGSTSTAAGNLTRTQNRIHFPSFWFQIETSSLRMQMRFPSLASRPLGDPPQLLESRSKPAKRNKVDPFYFVWM